MNAHGADLSVSAASASAPAPRGRLFRKYVALFVGVVAVALLANGLFEIWFSYQEHEDALIRIQHEQAQAAAAKIERFVQEIQNQIGWTTQLPWSAGTLEQRRFDALRLLRQVPAITELSQLDATGHEQLRVSRLAMDVVGSNKDYSHDPKFAEAMAHKVYYGPVYFRRESEPYMTLALAGTRRDAGVSVAEVNLKFIWDVVSQIKVGNKGLAYVVDADGRLIAHPDISLVLRNTDLSKLSQVRAARTAAAGQVAEPVRVARDVQGREVLTAAAPISPLGWFMFVELPISEAYAPLYASIERSTALLAAGLILAFLAALLLARRMVVPIQALRTGAARLGGGDLGQRITIKTGDELEALANQFNDMAGQLEESYADLEKKVDDRTKELTESLAQQTATSEVLQVISSSPGELKPVFDAMLDKALRLCEAHMGMMTQADDGTFRPLATRGVPPEFVEFMRNLKGFKPPPGTGVYRMVETKKTVQLADTAELPAYREGVAHVKAYVDLGRARTSLFVPMVKDGEVIGCFQIYRPEVRPFTDKQVAVVESFASQAVIAIENARLLTELRETLDRQTATADILRVIAATPGDAEKTLHKIAETTQRLFAANGVSFSIAEGDEYTLAIGVGHGAEQVTAALQAPTAPRRPVLPRTMPGTIIRENRQIHLPDLDNLPPEAADWPGPPILRLAGIRTVAGTPLRRQDHAIGILTVYRAELRPFTSDELDLLQSFADQAVIAIENARLLSEIRTARDAAEKALGDLRTAQASLVQSEKMASLGQLTAGIAHEIKNPLNFVNNFAKLSVELLDELKETAAPGLATLDAGKRAEVDELVTMLTGNLDKIGEHGRRADGIVKSMLAHSRGGSGDRQTVSINALIEESLNLAYHGARAQDKDFNVTLERDFDQAIAPLEVVPQDITRVFLNLFGNGFYAVRLRQKRAANGYKPLVKVSTRESGGTVAIRIRDNGSGIPPEVKKKMFEPFFTTKPTGEGTGLGLSISYDIVTQMHGGSISVDSQVDDFTEFTIQLPRGFKRDAAAKS